jgi:hypothetical protein
VYTKDDTLSKSRRILRPVGGIIHFFLDIRPYKGYFLGAKFGAKRRS